MSEFPPSPDLESKLHRLEPAAPTEALMTRLRAARPASRGTMPSPPAAAPTRRRLRPITVWAAAAAAVVLAALAAKLPRPSAPPTGSHDAPLVAASQAPAIATVTPAAPSSLPSVYLPVDSRRRLVGLSPVLSTPLPDEAPRRLLRALIIDDVAAVGAETDAVLIYSRAREVYLPVRSPVR